jgi:hypothetical protein
VQYAAGGDREGLCQAEGDSTDTTKWAMVGTRGQRWTTVGILCVSDKVFVAGAKGGWRPRMTHATSSRWKRIGRRSNGGAGCGPAA